MEILILYLFSYIRTTRRPKITIGPIILPSVEEKSYEETEETVEESEEIGKIKNKKK